MAQRGRLGEPKGVESDPKDRGVYLGVFEDNKGITRGPNIIENIFLFVFRQILGRGRMAVKIHFTTGGH